MHYAPRWGKPGEKYGRQSDHTRLVTDGRYKLYRNGHFYDTSKDPLEMKPLARFSNAEATIRDRFDQILREKETEHPFEWNNLEFIKPH